MIELVRNTTPDPTAKIQEQIEIERNFFQTFDEEMTDANLILVDGLTDFMKKN